MSTFSALQCKVSSKASLSLMWTILCSAHHDELICPSILLMNILLYFMWLGSQNDYRWVVLCSAAVKAMLFLFFILSSHHHQVERLMKRGNKICWMGCHTRIIIWWWSRQKAPNAKNKKNASTSTGPVFIIIRFRLSLHLHR